MYMHAQIYIYFWLKVDESENSDHISQNYGYFN